MRRCAALILVASAMLATTASGCSIGGRKSHMAADNPYVDVRTGQLIEDDDDDGIVGAFIDFLWAAIFGSDDE